MTDEEQKVIDDQKIEDDKTSKGNEDKGGDKEKSLEAQKEHFRTKYENSQKDFEEYKEANPVKEEKPNMDKDQNFKSSEGNEKLEAKVAKIEFTQAYPNLPPVVLQEALDQAKVKGITPEEALELPVVIAFAEAELAKIAVEKASQGGSGRSPKFKKEDMPETFEGHEKWAKKNFGLK